MTYSTPGKAGAFLTYPTNKLIGVIADVMHAAEAIEALNAAGFAKDRIELLCGPEGARRLDVSGKDHGVLAQLYRFLEGFEDMEHTHIQRHEQELLAGHFVIAVDAGDKGSREQVRHILKTHDGYFINFYGRWQIESLDA